MSLQDYYEDVFKSELGRSTSDLLEESVRTSRGLFNFTCEIKDKFLSNKGWKELKILELGSGRGGLGLSLARLGAQVTLVDFSPSALRQAEQIFAHEGLPVITIEGDVTYPDLDIPLKFDLIIDSHLLHCLAFDPQRSSYYGLVKDHLNEGGVFLAETMVHRKKLFIPEGFMLDQNNVLWQMFGQWKPVRKIIDSIDLETELKNSGFNISYFYFYSQYVFVPHKSFLDLPEDILPASVRFAVQKKID
jgi:SAM-dependent methyltransferase